MDKRFIPLALAHARDKDRIDGRTRLQKMVFVVQQELKEAGELSEDQLYEFFPYDYGPFSKELAEDIDDMLDEGLLDEDPEKYNDEGDVKYYYDLESDGEELVEQEIADNDLDSILEKSRHIKKQFNEDMDLPEVIDEVYSEYPDYAEESVY